MTTQEIEFISSLLCDRCMGHGKQDGYWYYNIIKRGEFFQQLCKRCQIRVMSHS